MSLPSSVNSPIRRNWSAAIRDACNWGVDKAFNLLDATGSAAIGASVSVFLFVVPALLSLFSQSPNIVYALCLTHVLGGATGDLSGGVEPSKYYGAEALLPYAAFAITAIAFTLPTGGALPTVPLTDVPLLAIDFLITEKIVRYATSYSHRRYTVTDSYDI
jgi:hypothetical protein